MQLARLIFMEDLLAVHHRFTLFDTSTSASHMDIVHHVHEVLQAQKLH